MLNRKGLHPTQVVAVAFTGTILLGTALLMLPVAASPGQTTSFIDALFTATSSVTVTGLGTLDTATHWSFFGHFVMATLMEIGGFGIVSFAILVGFLLEGRISLKNKMTTSSEASVAVSSDIKALLRNITVMMLGFEALLSAFLFIRFTTHYGYSWQEALGHSIFHSIASFNNAGFALYSDNLMGFTADGWILLPIAATVFIAGLGFPVLAEIRDRFKLKFFAFMKKPAPFWMPAQWSLNSRIVLWGSLVLFLAGAIGIGLVEWNNPRTLGPLDPATKVLNSVFASVMPRTAGFNSLDVGAMQPSTWLGTEILMFIGGASASTSGGIKLGTAVVLFYIIYTEIRGEAAVNVGNRRLPRSMQRQALTIVSITSFVVIGSTMLLRLTTDFSLDQILFEVVSAIGTVGLTTGITTELPDHAKFLIALVMLFGRLGPVVVATSLALRRTTRHFEYPKESPLIG